MTIRRKYTKEELQEAVDKSTNIYQVLCHLGLNPYGAAYESLRRALKEWGISTASFTGQVRRVAEGYQSKPLSHILQKDNFHNSTSLMKRLLREGVMPWQCHLCKRVDWDGGPIPLQLDHINGDACDNELENLRLLCPSCHSQQKTSTSCKEGTSTRRPDKRLA